MLYNLHDSKYARIAKNLMKDKNTVHVIQVFVGINRNVIFSGKEI